MYDNRTDHTEVAEAMQLIANAQYVCFLGFGFDADNIAKLKLDEICLGKPEVWVMFEGLCKCISAFTKKQIYPRI
jgi:hypothetical protein